MIEGTHKIRCTAEERSALHTAAETEGDLWVGLASATPSARWTASLSVARAIGEPRPTKRSNEATQLLMARMLAILEAFLVSTTVRKTLTLEAAWIFGAGFEQIGRAVVHEPALARLFVNRFALIAARCRDTALRTAQALVISRLMQVDSPTGRPLGLELAARMIALAPDWILCRVLWRAGRRDPRLLRMLVSYVTPPPDPGSPHAEFKAFAQAVEGAWSRGQTKGIAPPLESLFVAAGRAHPHDTAVLALDLEALFERASLRRCAPSPMAATALARSALEAVLTTGASDLLAAAILRGLVRLAPEETHLVVAESLADLPSNLRWTVVSTFGNEPWPDDSPIRSALGEGGSADDEALLDWILGCDPNGRTRMN